MLGIVLTREMPEAQGAIEVRVLSGRTLAVLWRAWPTLEANSNVDAAPTKR